MGIALACIRLHLEPERLIIMLSSYWSLCLHPTDHYTLILLTVPDDYAFILLISMLSSYWSLCFHPTDHYAFILLILCIKLSSYWPSLIFMLSSTNRPTDHYATILLTVLLMIMLSSTNRPTDHYATILLMIMHSSYWPSAKPRPTLCTIDRPHEADLWPPIDPTRVSTACSWPLTSCSLTISGPEVLC